MNQIAWRFKWTVSNLYGGSLGNRVVVKHWLHSARWCTDHIHMNAQMCQKALERAQERVFIVCVSA